MKPARLLFDSERRRLLGGLAGAIVAGAAPGSALQLLAQAHPAGEPASNRDQVARMLIPLFSTDDRAVWQLLIDAYADLSLIHI